MDDTTTAAPALAFRVSADALHVLVSGRLPGDDAPVAVEQLVAALCERGVRDTPPAADLLAALRAAADADGNLSDFTIVSGTPPGASRDGEVLWARDFFAAGFVEDAAGGVDFWQRRGNASVSAGEAFATVIEPRKGADGKNVYGTKLPAASPAPLKLRPGGNVRKEPLADGRSSLVAVLDGRVRVAQGVAHVDNVLVLNTVGLETGHIVHRGALTVKGDVEPGSRIEVGGDCEVRGSVERAVVIVGGNLLVHGGVLGRGDEGIRVQGSLRAKFILDADIVAGDGVAAESEIAHSQIRCRGPVEVPRGRIVAGDVMALGGITVGVVGGEGLSTLLSAGRDHLWDVEVGAREVEIRGHERNRSRIQNAVQPLLQREKSLSPQQREAATELLARASELETAVAELQRAVDAFTAESKSRAQARLVVLQFAHAGSVFVLPDGRLVLEADRDGPFHLRPVRGRVMALPGDHDSGGDGPDGGEHRGEAAGPGPAAAAPAAGPDEADAGPGGER